MGVQNLLPLVAPVSKRQSLRDFAGKRIAIDGFVWLHRSSFICPGDMVKNPGTDKILSYLMNKLQKIIDLGLKPIVVFDGQSLPQKAATNAKRHHDRAEAKIKAMQFEAQGNYNEAWSCYQKAVEITSLTVLTWAKALARNNIEFIVAPYEADAQLAYLARSGYVDCILTEDSDLLAYQTPLVLFKLDDQMMVTAVKFSDVLEHLKLNVEQFITICCLSGCDYIEHIARMGIQTALKLIRVHGNGENLLNAIRSEGKFVVPDNYEEQLQKAMLTFQHQRVYDPRLKVLKTLTPLDDPPDFLGPYLAPDLLKKVVTGKVDTRTLELLETEEETGAVSPYFHKTQNKSSVCYSKSQPDIQNKSKSQYFQKGYRSGRSSKESPQVNVSSRITSYFQLAPKC